MEKTQASAVAKKGKDPENSERKSDIQNEAPKPAKRKSFEAGVIDIKDLVDAQSRDIANARMTESKEDLSKNWLTRNWKRIWNHNLAKDFYNLREVSRVKKQILETGNLYEGEQISGGDGGNKAHSDEAMGEIIKKFTNEYSDEILKKEEKDSKKQVNQQATEGIKNLIKNYANGKIDETTFKKLKDDIIFSHDQDYYKNNHENETLYADNLLDIANEVKQSIANSEGLDNLDFDLNITLGKAKDRLNTENKKNTYDKIMEKTLWGKSVAQSAVMAGAVMAAYSGAKFLTRLAGKSLVAAKWAGFFGGLAAGAAVEGIKENARIKKDRVQDSRENAKGMKAEAGAKRREEMAKTRYETKGASEIVNQLDNALAIVERGNLTETEIREIMTNLSDLDARVSVGREKNVDLIHFKNFETLEKESNDLLIKSAELKLALRNANVLGNGNFDSDFKELVRIQSNELKEKEIGVKDEAFQKMKAIKVMKKMAQTAVFGGIFSFATQEVTSMFTHEDGIAEGAFKGIRNHFDHTPGKGMSDTTTPLEALRRWMAHDGPSIPKGSTHEVLFGSTHMHLPEGVEMTKNPDGTYDLINQGKVISGITLGSDGNLSDASQDLLKANGIIPKAGIISEKITENVTRTAQDYLNQHPEATEQVHFKDWMGNNTEMYEDPNNPGHLLGADQNELRTHWAGINGTGVDANGDYVMTVAHMTNDGSFQGGLSVAAQEQMAAGKLEAILSVTKEGQHHVFRIPIMPDGSFKVLHDSIPGQMLYSVGADGHADYDGYLLQIANPDGVGADGLKEEQLLGALKGNNNLHNVVDTVTKDTKAYNISFDFNGNSVIEPPIPIPIVPREPLPRNYYKKDDTSKKGPAKDKGIEKVKDLQSKNPIEGAVDPLKNGAEDLTKNEKVPVTEADFDENIKNARAEEAAVFAEFTEWEKNRKTPDEKPPQDLEDRYAAAQTKVADAEKAKAEFLARTDNEPAPAPASSETTPIVFPFQENNESNLKVGQEVWYKGQKHTIDKIVKIKDIVGGGEDIVTYNIKDQEGSIVGSGGFPMVFSKSELSLKEPVATPEPIIPEEPQEQILNEKELEARYDLDEKEGVISPRAIETAPIINTAPEITEPVQDQTNEVVEPIIETKTNETVVNKKESPVISQEETDLKKALDDAKKIRNRAKQRVNGQSKPTTDLKNALTIAEDNFKNTKTEYDNFIKNKPKLENTNSTQNVSEVISEAPEVVQSQPVETVVEPALNTENESPELEVPVPPRVSEVVPTNEFADEINRLKENLNTREYKIPGSNQYAKLDEQGNVIDVGGRSTGEWRGSGPNRIDAEETRQVKEMFEADKEALSKLESSLK